MSAADGSLPSSPPPVRPGAEEGSTSSGASSSATPQGVAPFAYGRRSTPFRLQYPAPGTQPNGAANWCSCRPAGRQTPTQLPGAPSIRSATAQLSGISIWPGCTANGVTATSGRRRHSGNRTGRQLPSTPQPSRSWPGVVAEQQQPAVGVREQQPVVAPRCHLEQRRHLALPPEVDGDRLDRPAARLPPVQRQHPARPVQPHPARAAAGNPRDLLGPERAARHPPQRRVVLPGRQGVHAPAVRRRRQQAHLRASDRAQQEFAGPGSGRIEQREHLPVRHPRRISTRPSASGATSESGSSGWSRGRGTAYGSGPSSVHRSGYQARSPGGPGAAVIRAA
ncbi:hypothetical protein H0E86_09325 [Streptomyces sp. SCSIO-PteL053]|nr:hypothetical protein H0E86_09325 [Streptomyces sp. SCSIO-PteL053]